MTENLPPGRYVVQFNFKSSALQGDHYLVVVLAGRKTLISNAVPGENPSRTESPPPLT